MVKNFEVTIEIHGRAFKLKRQALSYNQMVGLINDEFGNALILKTKDL